jgi:hypothetical protein
MPGRSPGQKSDSLDAHGLAEKLRSGQIERPVFEAPGQFSLLRERARMHSTIAQDLVRVQARLKSQYRARGIRTPGASVYGRRRREEWLNRLPRAARSSAERLYAQLDFLVGLKEEAEQDLIQESRRPDHGHSGDDPGARTDSCGASRADRDDPLSLPYPTAVLELLRTGDRHADELGLGAERTRGLGRRHNHVLKDIFKGAAMSVLVHYPDDPLHRHYPRQLEGGTQPTLARVTLARKLASTLLAQWKKEERGG